MIAAALWRAVAFGLLADGVTAFVAGAAILIETVARVALLAAFGSAPHNALADTQEREPALSPRRESASTGGRRGVCPGSVPGQRRRLDWLGTSRIEVIGSRFCDFGPPAGLRTMGRPPKILVLFLTVFEIHGILFFFGAAVAAGNESEAGMEGLSPRKRRLNVCGRIRAAGPLGRGEDRAPWAGRKFFSWNRS
jgi:hypothetical protein